MSEESGKRKTNGRKFPVTHGDMRDLAQKIAERRSILDDDHSLDIDDVVEAIAHVFGKNPSYKGDQYGICEGCGQGWFSHGASIGNYCPPKP